MVILNTDIVQGAGVHELVTVHWVDGPARVARLPPGGHCLRLQLPHLQSKTNLNAAYQADALRGCT